MKYQPEIDGLRALAVVPVVLYHTGVPGLDGGFIGVDVFFVISGYLITGLIWPEIRSGRFSIVEFYERRARRILPALGVVCAFSAVAASLLFVHRDMRDFSQSLVSVVAFSSNILFWAEDGYFAAPGEVKPLLHTWSLAVEEQFYILFPLLLILIGKYASGRLLSIQIGLIAISLGLSIYLVETEPSTAFYWLHSRAWELLLGASLATGAIAVSSSKVLADAASFIGALFIVSSVLLLSEETPFPGLAAVAPCLGAFLVIWANQAGPTLIGRVLAFSPVRGIGLISYSLYLWHWPLIVFVKYYTARPLSPIEKLAVVAASLILAVASWKFVEAPFRGSKSRYSRREVFAGAAACMLFFVAIGSAGHVTDGALLRSAGPELESQRHANSQMCLEEGVEKVTSNRLCAVGAATSSSPDFVVWGDSHADAFFPVFDELAANMRTHGVFAVEAGCPPLLGLARINAALPTDCRAFSAAVLDYISRNDISTVLLLARWDLALGPTAFEMEGRRRGAPRFIDELSGEHPPPEGLDAYEAGLRRTLATLLEMRRNVWLVLQAPNPAVRVPQYLSVRSSGSDVADVRMRLDERHTHETIRRKFKAIAAEYGVSVIDPVERLCGADGCVVAREGRTLYFDDDHLSRSGVFLFERDLRAALQGVLTDDAGAPPTGR